jgi:hypothetical protein
MAGKTITILMIIALLTGMLILTACRPTASVPTPDPEVLISQAAATVAVQLTMSAALTPSPAPTETRAPTNTLPPPTLPADQPAAPPAVTNTPAPANPSSTNQDGASFVDDVTIPDGTNFASGAVFDKTWRIKNTGKTTWTTSYALVFIDGERMNSPDSVSMPKEVKPGETVDITVRLTAPTKTGTFQTFFRLRNAGGQYFRLDGSGDLWVKITVGAAPTSTPGGETITPSPTPTETPTS